MSTRRLLSIILVLLQYSILAQLSPQPKAITERYFTEPDIAINTPAFESKRGFTEYEDMMPFLEKLMAQYPEVLSLSFIGESQKGEKIPMVKLKKSNTTGSPVKVWMQGGLHGNEPASTEGMLWLIQQICEKPEYFKLLDRLEIAIVPMANIDGMNKGSRYAANGLDLNRDQTKLNAPESTILKNAFNAFAPEVAVDFHEYRPFRKDYARISSYGVTVPFDVMFLYSGNLNVPKNLRLYTKDRFVQAAADALKAKNFRYHDYFSSSNVMGAIQFNQGSHNARSSATSYALTNCVSSLIEIRGVGIGRTSFKRRVLSTFTVAISYLQSSYEYGDELRAILEQAMQEQNPAVVKARVLKEERDLFMIDVESGDSISIRGLVSDAWQATAKLSRVRPTAYILLPETTHLVDRLRTLGLEVHQISSPQSLAVESYEVTEFHREVEEYEGVHRQELVCELNAETVEIPAGSFIVYLNQKHANLAIEVLEPEAPNSFASFSVFETAAGAQLPYYRFLSTQKLHP